MPALHTPTAVEDPVRPLSFCRRATVALAAALLAGCASVPPDPGFAQVAGAVKSGTGGDLAWLRSADDQAAIDRQVAGLLARELSSEGAVQVALWNHRGLQARLHGLGLTHAEVLKATRPPNPSLGLGRMKKGDEIEIERGLHLDLARWLLLPWTAPMEVRRLEREQRDTAQAVLSIAAEARRAWVMAVAAQEALAHQQQVLEAAAAAAELARRMEQAGNFNRLQRAREQAFQADAALGLARAEQARRSARERLARALGLWGAQLDFRLPARLPDLPAQPREAPDIEREAMAQRLDVQAARLDLERKAQALGLTRATAGLEVLELGLMRNSGTGEPRETGWEIGLELPLFDRPAHRQERARLAWAQAREQAAQRAIDARSEVREAYGQYRIAHDIARHHREELVPLVRRIADEQLLRYNGMLIGVFELLAETRAQIASVQAAIEAQRDFWLADAELRAAMVGAAGREAAPAPSAAGGTRPAAGGGH